MGVSNLTASLRSLLSINGLIKKNISFIYLTAERFFKTRLEKRCIVVSDFALTSLYY